MERHPGPDPGSINIERHPGPDPGSINIERHPGPDPGSITHWVLDTGSKAGMTLV